MKQDIIVGMLKCQGMEESKNCRGGKGYLESGRKKGKISVTTAVGHAF